MAGIPTLANLNTRGLYDAIAGKRFTPNTAGWELWPAKSNTRGKIICEDLNKLVEFQFNPTKLNVKKEQTYYNRTYPGKASVEPIWINGGVREITFDLIFDATASSAYDKVGLYNDDQGNFTSEVHLSSHKNPKDAIMADISARAFKGTLDVTETLESFTYPMLSDIRRPRFTDGVAVFDPNGVSLPPPTVVFYLAYGIWKQK